MNPILTLTHNALEMTKKAVESFYGQDEFVKIFVVDNGSTDGTEAWLSVVGLCLERYTTNAGVSMGWNAGLDILFNEYNAEHVLVCNNDVQLPPWFYRELLSYDVPFVTGVSCDSIIPEAPPRSNLVPHPDFSAFLIRRKAWDIIGPFDEGMKMYAQDCDYHIRATEAGVPLLAANAPFYHERSSTLRLSTPENAAKIEAQANADRAFFFRKWGFAVGSQEYADAVNARLGTPHPFPGEIR